MRSILAALSSRLLLAASALLAAGCSREIPAPLARSNAETPARGGTLNLATIGDIRSMDPAAMTDGLAPQMIAHLFAGLLDYDAEGRVKADLAERYTVEDDGLTYRFFLREGVRFHDGEELTADDIPRSAERALHPSAPNPYTPYYASIAGFDAFGAKRKETLDGIVVEGRYVVAFHLATRDATFLPVLAMLPIRPVCKSAGTRYSDSWHPCGTGPFKLPEDGWQHGHSVKLVRHDAYFRPGLPRLDAVQWTFHENQTSQTFKFVRGEVDILREFLSPDLYRFQADARWKPFADFEVEKQILGESMNVEMPPFDNVEIRRAVASAINRDDLQKLRSANLRVATGPVPRGVFGFDPALEGQKFDYEAALEHMRRAGYPYDPVTKTGGWPHVVRYDVYKQGLQEFVVQAVAQQLERIGIRLEIHVVNYPTMMALRGRRKTSAMGPGFWTEDFPDALSFLEPLFHSRSISDEDSNNMSFYSNPRVDDLIDRAKKELDEDRRKALYTETQKILVDDAPWAFTTTFRFYTQRQPYVRDHRTHPMWMHDLTETWLDRAAGPTFAKLDPTAVFR